MIDVSLRAFAAADPARAGIFCDFDGTLSEIVSKPEDARALDDVAETLERLATKLRVVAIVSGRTIEDLERLISVPRVHLVGVHGLVEKFGSEILISPDATKHVGAIERAAKALDAEHIQGAFVERKQFTVAIHVRNATDPGSAMTQALATARGIASREQLDVKTGRLVVEIAPRDSADKGDAVRTIGSREGLNAVAALGDDVTDLAMFRAAREFDVSACVGVRSVEGPSELCDQADVCVSSPAEVLSILQAL